MEIYDTRIIESSALDIIDLIEARNPEGEDMYPSNAYRNRLTARARRIDRLTESVGRITAGADRADKARDMLDAFFDRKNPTVRSFKECYIALTGDTNVTGRLKDCEPWVLRESIGSSTFGAVLGDAITRALIRDYRTPDRYSVWRHLANIVQAEDFRTKRRVRVGGYGDLATIAEKGPYPALVSPPEEEVTWAPGKRGGTEEITLEAISNDDVSLVRDIPRKLSQAAKRTLAKFVLDFLEDNPVIYDGLPLFDAAHGNIGSNPLSAVGLMVGHNALREQTEAGSGDRLDLRARHLFVPFELEETGFNLFRRATNNDADFVESLDLELHPVWYWTDTNDWVLSADTADVPIIEMGFMHGGENEPELFVQDAPIQGSLFTHDSITYKIRHVYGGAPVEFRGVFKSVVA